MSFINSVFYVQQQIKNVLQLLQEFIQVYIDNLIVFSHSQDKHMSHLYQFFFLLIKYNIIINLKKTYIDISTMHFLDQRILSLEFFIAEEKINIIVKLNFLKNFKNLETYFE